MQTFHGNQEVKDTYISRIKDHMKADAIIQGTGYENGKGCAVGCTLENYDHTRYPIELGLPIWLAHLQDEVFEGLSEKESKTFPLEFLEAIPVGIEWTEEDQLRRMRLDLDRQRLEVLLKTQRKLHPNDDFGVIQVLEEVISLQKEYCTEDKKWAAAYSAANSAEYAATISAEYSAAEYAARSVAWSVAEYAAEYAAISAAHSAEYAAAISAEYAVRSAEYAAVRSAAWSLEKDRLLFGLKGLGN